DGADRRLRSFPSRRSSGLQGQKIIITLIILVIAVILFMTYNMGNNIDYVLSRRGIRLATMIIVGISVAFSSVIFQTITNNRILRSEEHTSELQSRDILVCR